MRLKKNVWKYTLPHCDAVSSIWAQLYPNTEGSKEFRLMSARSIDFIEQHVIDRTLGLPVWYYFDDITLELYVAPAPNEDMDVHVTILHKEII